jgi:hypothetical protein
MERFFARPDPEKVAEHIYHQVIAIHETGGHQYVYRIPQGMSISFVNDVIDKLSSYTLDIWVELYNGFLVIDWS